MVTEPKNAEIAQGYARVFSKAMTEEHFFSAHRAARGLLQIDPQALRQAFDQAVNAHPDRLNDLLELVLGDDNSNHTTDNHRLAARIAIAMNPEDPHGYLNYQLSEKGTASYGSALIHAELNRVIAAQANPQPSKT